MQVSFNYIDCLNITKKIARIGDHCGDCTDDVIAIMQLPAIKRQMKKIDPERLKKELWDYGAWSDEELQNHEDNLQRILWIACGNINDGNI